MEGPQHRDRGNGGAGQIGRDVLGDGRESENVDVQHLAGAPRHFEILAAVISQPEVQTLSGCRLLDDVCVAFELVADGRPDEIGPVRVEPFLHHEIDVTEVDIAEVDRDLLGIRGLGSQLAYAISHHSTLPSSGMVFGSHMDVQRGLSRGLQKPWERHGRDRKLPLVWHRRAGWRWRCHAAEGAASLSIALALMTMIAVGVVFWLWGPTKERPEVD